MLLLPPGPNICREGIISVPLEVPSYDDGKMWMVSLIGGFCYYRFFIKKKKNGGPGINNCAFSMMGEIKFHELKPYLIVS